MSHFQIMSNITSLSDPPEIEHKIFWYLSLFIIDHARIMLSQIVLFTGHAANNSSIFLGFLTKCTSSRKIYFVSREVKPYLVSVFLHHYHIPFSIQSNQRSVESYLRENLYILKVISTDGWNLTNRQHSVSDILHIQYFAIFHWMIWILIVVILNKHI